MKRAAARSVLTICLLGSCCFSVLADGPPKNTAGTPPGEQTVPVPKETPEGNETTQAPPKNTSGSPPEEFKFNSPEEILSIILRDIVEKGGLQQFSDFGLLETKAVLLSLKKESGVASSLIRKIERIEKERAANSPPPRELPFPFNLQPLTPNQQNSETPTVSATQNLPSVANTMNVSANGNTGNPLGSRSPNNAINQSNYGYSPFMVPGGNTFQFNGLNYVNFPGSGVFGLGP